MLIPFRVSLILVYKMGIPLTGMADIGLQDRILPKLDPASQQLMDRFRDQAKSLLDNKVHNTAGSGDSVALTSSSASASASASH